MLNKIGFAKKIVARDLMSRSRIVARGFIPRLSGTQGTALRLTADKLPRYRHSLLILSLIILAILALPRATQAIRCCVEYSSLRMEITACRVVQENERCGQEGDPRYAGPGEWPTNDCDRLADGQRNTTFGDVVGGHNLCQEALSAAQIPTEEPRSVVEDLVEPRLQIEVPGLQPFTRPEKFTTPQGRTFVDIDFLSRYIGGIYTWLVGIVGIVAGLMIIWAGVNWLTAGGSPDRISDAKRKIVDALVGLVLVLGSYIILRTINPDLVVFRPLRVEVVESYKLTPEEEEEEGTGIVSEGQTVCNTIEKCRLLCNTDQRQWPTSGGKTIPVGQTVTIPNDLPGLRSSSGARVTSEMLQALRVAGQNAQARGYTINVTSGYRPLFRQIQLVCNKLSLADQNRYDINKIGSAIAWPGGSNHGSGDAVDIQLLRGREIKVCSDCFDSQGNAQYRQGAEDLAEIMFNAGFVRYCREIWHFELPNNSPCRSNFCRSNTPEDLSC